MTKILLGLLACLLAGGCLGVPPGISPVKNFQLDRYLGTWYEIARLDHPFERGLHNVTAEYSIHPDGGVRVVNRGYSVEDNAWQKAEGRAVFVREPDIGYLKVTFFWPFSASYVVFELDRQEYSYAFVTSSDRSYLWLLARTPSVDQAAIDRFLERTEELGFRTEDLIFVRHSTRAP